MVNNERVLVRNNVHVSGKGTQAMVFAHGFGCDQIMWRFLTPAFLQDYQLILFDYVGSGKSDVKSYDKERYSNLTGYAQDVLEICHALSLKDIIFVGHSVSTMIGVLAAIQQPEIFNNLILIGPSPKYINEGEYFGGFEKDEMNDLMAAMEKNNFLWANMLAPKVMRNPGRPELTEELTESFCAADPVIIREFAEATFFSDNRNDLPKLKTPTLILQSSEDLIAPLPVGKYVHDNIPSSKMTVLKAMGHCPHMSHPDETAQAITNYLKGV